MWCIFMLGQLMAIPSKSPEKPKEASKSVRASVSFPRELYKTLGLIAKQKKVTVAWIVRDAAEKYVGEQWPLLK